MMTDEELERLTDKVVERLRVRSTDMDGIEPSTRLDDTDNVIAANGSELKKLPVELFKQQMKEYVPEETDAKFTAWKDGNGVAAGSMASVSNDSDDSDGVAIGRKAGARPGSVAVGSGASAGTGGVAIGADSDSGMSSGVAIGNGAKTSPDKNVVVRAHGKEALYVDSDNKLHVYDGSTDVDVADRLSGLETDVANAQPIVIAGDLTQKGSYEWELTITSDNLKEAFDATNRVRMLDLTNGGYGKLIYLWRFADILLGTWYLQEKNCPFGLSFAISLDGKTRVDTMGAGADRVKLTIGQDKTLSGYDSWREDDFGNEAEANGFTSVRVSRQSGDEDFVLPFVVSLKSDLVKYVRSANFVLDDEEYYLVGEVSSEGSKGNTLELKKVVDADTKYAKPEGGIPVSDLSSDVQDSLGKADTAYQKPSGGIASSDLSADAQESLVKANSAYQKPTDGIPVSDLSTDLQKKVREISPKEALFIDLWNDVTKPFNGKYNEDTGYYEMNGLTDITYDEAVALYNEKKQINYGRALETTSKSRTFIFTGLETGRNLSVPNLFLSCANLIVLNFKKMYISGTYLFKNDFKLKTIENITVYGNYADTVFGGCTAISTLTATISGNYSIVLQDSPLITYDSFKYIIDNAKNTAAITITVHPNSYSYLQGTTAPIDAVGGTTEQWKALVTAATAKQISFAEGTPTT